MVMPAGFSPYFQPARDLLRALLMFLLILTGSSHAMADSFTASVDRTTIGEQETLQLTYRFEPQVLMGSPDFSVLDKDFQVLQGPSRMNSFRSYNGQSQSQTEWTLVLLPKRTGAIQIPAISFKGETSNVINLQVNAMSADVRQKTDQDAFFDIEVEKQPIYYVQGQILYTEKLYYRVNHQDANLTDFEVEDARVQALGEPRQYISVINGERVGVYERRFAIYPEKAGTLVIPGQRFQAMASARSNPYDRWSTRQSLLSTVSKPIELEIQPIPADYPPLPWLPARALTINEQFSTDNWKVGEAVTRTISIHTDGLSASQIVLPEPMIPDGLKRYPDQPEYQDQTSDQGVSGDYRLAVALVPTAAGDLTLPELTLAWWNTNTNRLEYARLPAHTFKVMAAANQPPQATTATSNNAAGTSNPAVATAPVASAATSANNPWLWGAILLLGLGNLVFAILWWRGRQPAAATTVTAENNDQQQAWQNLRRSCQQGNPGEVRAALQAWLHSSQNGNMATPGQFRNGIDDPALQAALDELDASLFSPRNNSAWNGNNLWLRLQGWQQQQAKAAGSSALPPLYAN